MKQEELNEWNESETVQRSAQKKGIKWGNVGSSFFIALFYFAATVVLYAVIIQYTGDKTLAKHISSRVDIVFGIIIALWAKKLKTSQYKNCAPAWAAFVGIWFFGAVGFWMIMYQFLQIKQGYAVLKDEQAEEE